MVKPLSRIHHRRRLTVLKWKIGQADCDYQIIELDKERSNLNLIALHRQMSFHWMVQEAH
jgi:hypothetical protein